MARLDVSALACSAGLARLLPTNPGAALLATGKADATGV